MNRIFSHEIQSPPTNREAIIRRFMAKVEKSESGCWNWIGGKDKKGYGKFSIGRSHNPDGTRRNSMVTATRVVYELLVGPIPDTQGFHGTCVLHHCDNPSCVNPEHLFLGSNSDNVHDMDVKNRRVNAQLKGSAHHASKLTEEAVYEIAKRIKAGESQVGIAKEFGVIPATINHIKKGRLWNHLNLFPK
jgi:hypothetical protein